MKQTEELTRFVRDALIAGRSRSEIGAALRAAGWTDHEITGALAAWAGEDFNPPVPRPRPFVSAREAFLYGLVFVSLAVTAFHVVSLSFNLIDTWLPELGETYAVTYRRDSIRWSIASLIVFAPLFFFLNARANRAIRQDPGRRRSAMRKWVGYITLFLAAIALLGDLIFVIYALLTGDLTLRVVLKAIVVAAVAGIIFLYFRYDLREDADDL